MLNCSGAKILFSVVLARGAPLSPLRYSAFNGKKGQKSAKKVLQRSVALAQFQISVLKVGAILHPLYVVLAQMWQNSPTLH
jgi:hypothetical protein